MGTEEFLSLRSSAKHKDAAEPMLKRLVDGVAAPPVESVDLLGGGSTASSAPAPAVETADLLGTKEEIVTTTPTVAAPVLADSDLLGSLAEPSAGVASLDPMVSSASSAPVPSGGSVLDGLTLDTPSTAAAPSSASDEGKPSDKTAHVPAKSGIDAAAAAALASLSIEQNNPNQDAFGFVGAEMGNEAKRQGQEARS